MKASSSVDFLPLLAAGLTGILTVIFWMQFGSGSQAAAGYEKLEGKVIAMAGSQPQAAVPTAAELPPAPAAARAAGVPQTHAPKPRTRAATRKTGQAQVESNQTPVVASAPASAAPQALAQPQPAATLPASPAASMDRVLQTIADNFEDDPTKYPLDRSAKADRIVLSLAAIARRDGMFVLKVAVTNGTASDFFVKEFVVQADGAPLACRSSFRILVEPQRSREGYVLFAKPRQGADVHLTLKEDGGKGRMLGLAVPYPF